MTFWQQAGLELYLLLVDVRLVSETQVWIKCYFILRNRKVLFSLKSYSVSVP